jgi:hypothetical protein
MHNQNFLRQVKCLVAVGLYRHWTLALLVVMARAIWSMLVRAVMLLMAIMFSAMLKHQDYITKTIGSMMIGLTLWSQSWTMIDILGGLIAVICMIFV